MQRDTMILLPAFNEAKYLPHVLAGLAEHAPSVPAVVVDDGSTDATAAVARAGGAEVVRHPFNLGYGAALQTGYKLALARGVRLVVQMDADGQHDPGQVATILEPVARDELDLAVGSRFFPGSDYRAGPARDTGRHLLRALARLFGIGLSDPTSGFQAMNRAVLALYCRDDFPFDYPDVDVLVLVRRHGLRIGERPTLMRSSVRASQLHGGFRPVYYFYRMVLALLTTSPAPSRPYRGIPG